LYFSIITPTFNSENKILKHIYSINQQTFKNFEQLFIDNLSTDRTLDLIQKFSKNNFRIISEKDSGIYNAMNKGINNSVGEYLLFLNSDDWIESNTLEVIDLFIKENNYPDVVYGNANFYYKDIYKFKKNASIKNICRNNNIFHSSTYIKRKVFNVLKYNENFKISSDYVFFLELYKNNFIFKKINMNISNISLGGASSNLLISAREFYQIQIKYNGLILGSINFILRYHYHIFKIFFIKIKKIIYNEI
jgi:glycosyltransferase involved in cell wall biosynthesis